MREKLPNKRRRGIRHQIGLVPLLLFVLVASSTQARAQDPPAQREFWPEIDVYVHVKPKVRLYLLGTISKSVEDGEPRRGAGYEAQIGAHVDYIPNDNVILRAGYRYGTAVGDSSEPFKEHRLLTEQTFRKLIPGDLILSDRNREDFRLVNGGFSFRYRNRVTLEREFRLPKFVPKLLTGRSITPYVSGEIFYDTRYGIWNRNRLAVGFQQSMKRGLLRKMGLFRHQIIFDFYLMHQNDSRASTPHVNAVGAALGFYF